MALSINQDVLNVLAPCKDAAGISKSWYKLFSQQIIWLVIAGIALTACSGSSKWNAAIIKVIKYTWVWEVDSIEPIVSYALTMSQKNTQQGRRWGHAKPTLSVLQLQVTSCQVSVNQSWLPTAQSSQNTLQGTNAHTHRERENMNLASNPTGWCVKATVCPNAYQVKLLHRLVHGPFLTAGACSWKKKIYVERGFIDKKVINKLSTEMI